MRLERKAKASLINFSTEDGSHRKSNDKPRDLRARDSDESDQKLAILARGILRARRERSRHFSSEIFSEPAWDMLLDLFVNSVEGKRVSTTSLCIASGSPATTGLRWISILEQESLIHRTHEKVDKRFTYVSLSKEGYIQVKLTLLDHLQYLHVEGGT